MAETKWSWLRILKVIPIALGMATGAASVGRDFMFLNGQTLEPHAAFWAWLRICFVVAFATAWLQEHKAAKTAQKQQTELENAHLLAYKHIQIKELLGMAYARGQNLALQSEWAPIEQWRQDLKRIVISEFGDAEASLFDDEALAMQTWGPDKSRIRLSALLDTLRDLIARSTLLPFSPSSLALASDPKQHMPSNDREA
jgi:hypothetical protein